MPEKLRVAPAAMGPAAVASVLTMRHAVIGV